VAAADPARTVPQGETSQTGPEAVALPDREKKVSLGADRYFVLVFDKRPAMGTVIAKVELYSAGGARDTSLEVLGNVDMPSMRGAHSLGDRPFQLNKKGDYLLPMGLVMPGEWEIALTFRKDGRVLFRGYHRFKV
jgi:hypothetical protein